MTLYLAPLAAFALALLALPAAAQDQIPAPRAGMIAADGTAAPADPAAEPATEAPTEEPAAAEDDLAPLPAEGLSVDDFRWQKRLVLVFADSPDNPAFADQMQMLAALPDELAMRDVVVIFDTDPEAKTELRQQLRPRGFMLVLMDKDGQIAQRKPFPWTVREISRAIDKMPLRQEELRTRRLTP
ncbi:DUF4174 domain-containing protein [Frigidibacter sp.]|uniref:DUF4174 domain-containing protein n=1 Tax=Frigidibacter sp. TaxID=2586418 RepID=UPI002732DBF1|nr:DUF4174 domain-containing protein [Frigidibacter sp.]MDP3339711.1 DUF4174 domain-containing protein [Frigidibacter sp.]